PGARFASAHALAAALERIGDGQPLRHRPDTGTAGDPRRWWRVHQIATSVAYAGLLVPIGLAGDRLGDKRLGILLFLVAMAAAIAAITIRMHLLFAADSMPAQGPHTHPRRAPC